MERKDYLRQLKSLIKKYHPDLCQDETVKSHFSEITVQLNNELDKARNTGTARGIPAGKNPSGGSGKNPNAAAPVSDQGYAYYRQGIKFYRYIHPDQFYKKNLNTPYEPVNYGEQLKALEKIFLSFNLAEYYFRKVINDYPESGWAEDAKDKIKLLKKLWKSYEKRAAEENPRTISARQLDAFMNDTGIQHHRF
ncbi:hypothetical protein [Breznakiella homolactica]|uniref:J domain-containing protein n=1 Tax=Breznakiella homolactica TaxID=2798577 RepID=A0A7T7XLL6_9SPIR|nr:hypothetical protein [Breznakiella homolactica]QQO08498.1 hypothetical protein JFL75_16405 [Breznakiella homolactica]